MHRSKIGSVQNAVNLSTIICSTLNFFMHIFDMCDIPAKCQKDTLNAIEGADFANYALLPIIQYVHWSKIE